MLWPADYHMHTPLCRHATGEPAEYAEQAVRVGLTEMGFSDHAPMPRDDFDDWRMRLDQLDDYIAKVIRTRRAFPQLTIRLALEIDYLPGQEAWVRELAARHPWDYLIGSVHYVTDSWDVDNPNKRSEWHRRDIFEVWSAYFDRLTQAAGIGLFDIIGHADLPKKFGHLPAQDCAAIFTPFLRAAAEKNVAMELNTAGLRKDCREIYPGPRLLQMAREHGVAITFGSDAHAPAEVGQDFAAAIKLARATGYTHYWRFEQRKRITEAIPAPPA